MSEPGAPHLTVRAGARTLALGARPWLMGIVNATPDSFSDGGVHRTLDERVALARELTGAGADVIDVGGESGVANDRPSTAQEEIARVVPLIERLAGELGAVVSVDTYKPAVAEAAIAAGACDRQRRQRPARPGAGRRVRARRARRSCSCTRAWRRRGRCSTRAYDDVVRRRRRLPARADGARARARRRDRSS